MPVRRRLSIELDPIDIDLDGDGDDAMVPHVGASGSAGPAEQSIDMDGLYPPPGNHL